MYTADCLLPLAFAVLDTFFNITFKKLGKTPKMENFEKLILTQKSLVQNSDEQTEQYRINEDLLEYYQRLLLIEQREFDHEITFVNLLLKILSTTPKNRPNFDQIFGLLEVEMGVLNDTNWANYSFVAMAERHYQMESLKPSDQVTVSLKTRMDMQTRENSGGFKKIRPDYRLILVVFLGVCLILQK